MNRRHFVTVASVGIVSMGLMLTVLAGCASDGSGGGYGSAGAGGVSGPGASGGSGGSGASGGSGGSGASVGSNGSNAASPGTTLATDETSLGRIVVDSLGDTVYVFEHDAADSGKSTCYGSCAATWPALITASAKPTVTGVTGTVGTITRTDGSKQLTLNGMPLYTFASDSKPGDISGQGFMSAWYVVSPAGAAVMKSVGSGSSTGNSSGSSGSSSGGGW